MRIGSYATAAVLAVGVVACGGGGGSSTPPGPGDPLAGEGLFGQACAACHGTQGEGVDGFAASLVGSEFIAVTPDTEMIEFLKRGVTAGDPRNTTGVPMPPRGGSPTLSDQDLADIVAWLRTVA